MPGSTVPVVVTDGHYDVELHYSASAFNGTERWIQVSIDPDGSGPGDPEFLAPRIHVVSAPFAYVAETLDGHEGDDLEESDEIAQGDQTLQSQIDSVSGDLNAHVTAPEPHKQCRSRIFTSYNTAHQARRQVPPRPKFALLKCLLFLSDLIEFSV